MIQGIPKKLGVVGAGTIGTDMAFRMAQALGTEGHEIFVTDSIPEALAASEATIRSLVGKLVSKGKMDQGVAATMLASLRFTPSLGDLAECGLVVEATTESEDVKKTVLAAIEKTLGETRSWVIAPTSSSFQRATMAGWVTHGDRIVNYHPFTPAARRASVEVVASPNADATKHVTDFALALGAFPFVVKDVPCFAGNDVFTAMMLAAGRLVEDGVVTAGELDAIVDGAIGGGGPFFVMDYISGLRPGNGIAIVRHCANLLRAVHGNWFEPCKLLAEKGAEKWDPQRPEEAVRDEVKKTVLEYVYGAMFWRALAVLEAKVMDPSAFNFLTKEAFNLKVGLLELMEQLGVQEVVRIVTAFADQHKDIVAVPACLQGDRPSLPEFVADVFVHGPDDKGIATVTLVRPEVRNALRDRTLDELREMLEGLYRDDYVRGIVFTGLGGTVAGADIRGLAALETAGACMDQAMVGQDLTLFMERVGRKKPIVAAIDGAWFGGGSEFAMACCARVVTKGAVVGQPEVNLGIIPGYGGTQRLPRLVGVKVAARLMRTAEVMSGEEAVRSGWATAPLARNAARGAKELILRHLDPRDAFVLAPVSYDPVAVQDTDFPEVGTDEGKTNIGHRSTAIDAILVRAMRDGLIKSLPEGLGVEAMAFGSCRNTKDMSIGLETFVTRGAKAKAEFVNA